LTLAVELTPVLDCRRARALRERYEVEYHFAAVHAIDP